MAEQTQAASSPAEVADPFNGSSVSLADFSHWRNTGETSQPAAATDAPEETAEVSEGDEPESEPDSEPEESQEPLPKGSPAQKRILQLLAKTKELERQLASVAKPDATSDPSPAQTAQPAIPQNYQEWRKTFKPSAWVEEFAKANPDASYEDANAAMADYLGDARRYFDSIEQRNQATAKEIDTKVEEARTRYENFDEIKTSFLSKVISDKGVPLIPVQVLSIINDSDVMTDLLYTIGSDEKEAAKFLAMAKASPNKAIRYVARVESLIEEEHAKNAADPTEKAPVKKTSAPKPPSPVTGGSSRAFDMSDESLSCDEWMRKRNQQIARKKA